jgi:hypothetical protein
VIHKIRSYDLNFHPVPHGVTVSFERYTRRFTVFYGGPSDAFAGSSGFVHLYTLRFKEKEKRAALVANTSVHNKGSVKRFRFTSRLEFQSGSELYKNFTIMFQSEFEFLIHLIGEKISKKDTAARLSVTVLGKHESVPRNIRRDRSRSDDCSYISSLLRSPHLLRSYTQTHKLKYFIQAKMLLQSVTVCSFPCPFLYAV